MSKIFLKVKWNQQHNRSNKNQFSMTKIWCKWPNNRSMIINNYYHSNILIKTWMLCKQENLILLFPSTTLTLSKQNKITKPWRIKTSTKDLNLEWLMKRLFNIIDQAIVSNNTNLNLRKFSVVQQTMEWRTILYGIKNRDT